MTSFYMYVFKLKRRYWVFTVELINHNGCYTSAPHPVTGLDDRALAPPAVIAEALLP